MKEIAVIIPVRKGDDPKVALQSLSESRFKDFDVIVSWQEKDEGVSRTRNLGAAKARGYEFILFSDCDIQWKPNAIDRLRMYLKVSPYAAYAYGSYEMGGQFYCNREFSGAWLRQTNFISTMSLIRNECFPGFDENLFRLVDWDLWLQMLFLGRIGTYVGDGVLFTTKVRDGITFNGVVSWTEARHKIAIKHNL